LFQIPTGFRPTSVAVHPHLNLVAVAIQGQRVTDPGTVCFYSIEGCPLGAVTVGSLPDMIVWTNNGRQLLTANEGEPSGDYTIDPEGSISIITLGPGLAVHEKTQKASVATVRFAGFNDRLQELLDKGVRIFGPNTTVAQDLEPEYIAVSRDNRFAWVTLQENNAIATIDLHRASVVDIVGLGFKDHNLSGFGLDASDKDMAIAIAPWPVWGMYLPDGIAAFHVRGVQYLITANEGDVRDYPGYGEGTTVNKVKLDPLAFPDAKSLQLDNTLGRLKMTKTLGDPDLDGDYDRLFSFGGRSFSIWDSTGNLVFDSGEQFEQITAAVYPGFFNSTNDKTAFDDRSDDKGPEPEGLVLGTILGRTVAFIGLERIGGIMVYDVTDPANPALLTYVNNRDFAAAPATAEAGDLGPEGMVFISADQSPIHKPVLIVANEVSGSTTLFKITVGWRLNNH
jgi:2',3'-cyclic-nucleotide 2'-phosphodiesterase/3'-nucleotidase/5'-nucleotidase